MYDYRLETPRLVLRPPTLDDAPDIQTYVSDWELAKTTLNIPHPYPADGAREWLRQQFDSPEPDNFYFTICLKDTSLIGAINVRISPRHHHAEIGYWIGRPFWGQGYASEAARRIVVFCFEELDLNRVYANYFSENPASRRVMENAGMSFEGMLKQHYFRWSKYIDVGICGITREAWLEQNS
jgi:ribosomal-protein-alanine N-acetyltransferase